MNLEEICAKAIESAEESGISEDMFKDMLKNAYEYGITAEVLEKRLEKFLDKIMAYLEDKTKYGLKYNLQENESVKLIDWYEFLGNGCREEHDGTEREDKIDTGKKIVSRLKGTLKSCGLEIGELNGKDHLDKIKLMTFLYRFSCNEGIKLKSFFSSPSMENMEYLSDEELVPANSELTTVLHFVLMAKSDIELYKKVSYWLAKIEMAGHRLEDDLILYLKHPECNEEILRQVKSIVSIATKNIEKTLDEKKENDFPVYNEMLLILDYHNMESEANSMISLYDYIENMNISIKDINKEILTVLFITDVKIDEIIEFAKQSKELMCFAINISGKKYDSIVDGLLGNYAQIIGDKSEVTGLHVMIMIEEIAYGLKGKLDKEQVKYYRYETADAQRTFKAALRDGEGQIKMQNILGERLNAIYYTYIGREKSYFIISNIIKKIYRNKEKLYRCRNITEIEKIFGVLDQTYKSAVAVLENEMM